MTGKWSKLGVPHKGWVCVDVEDRGAPDAAVCEMCEVQNIRYVHYMEHRDFDEVLGVGCICAEHMENDYEKPRQRERGLRNAAQRKRRWLVRKWQTSANGNTFLNTDGMNIVVFKRKSSEVWAARIVNRISGGVVYSRRTYESEDAAKLKAFDAMIFLKLNRGWGDRRSGSSAGVYPGVVGCTC